MKPVFAVDFRVWFVECDHVSERISSVNDPAIFVFHPHIKRGVIGKSIRHQRISADIAADAGAARDADALFPNRPGVGDLDYFGRRIEIATEIGEIDMGANMISAEILHRE